MTKISIEIDTTEPLDTTINKVKEVVSKADRDSDVIKFSKYDNQIQLCIRNNGVYYMNVTSGSDAIASTGYIRIGSNKNEALKLFSDLYTAVIKL